MGYAACVLSEDRISEQANQNSIALLLGVVNHTENHIDFPPRPVDQRFYDYAENHARETLGNVAFGSAFAAGQQMSMDEALDLAWQTAEEITGINAQRENS